MVLPTGVSPRIGQASRHRFSPPGERRCAYKLQLSAAMYAQMYAQSLDHQSWSVSLGIPNFWCNGVVVSGVLPPYQCISVHRNTHTVRCGLRTRSGLAG